MLTSNISGHTVLTFTELPSTSTYLRENCLPAGTVVRAVTQSAGRGRRGNSFSSGEGGLYFSVKLLRSMPEDEMWAVTFMAANAVCDAIAEQGGEPLIKWVNDVYLGGRKVCGILCEVRNDHLILGMGVNVKKTHFPPEVAEVATTLEDEGIRVSAEELFVGIIGHFDRAFDRWNLTDTLEKYRSRSMLTGKDVTYTENGEKKYARVTGIAHNGNLLCEKDGESFALSSGEVHTVRTHKRKDQTKGDTYE